MISNLVFRFSHLFIIIPHIFIIRVSDISVLVECLNFSCALSFFIVKIVLIVCFISVSVSAFVLSDLIVCEEFWLFY